MQFLNLIFGSRLENMYTMRYSVAFALLSSKIDLPTPNHYRNTCKQSASFLFKSCLIHVSSCSRISLCEVQQAVFVVSRTLERLLRCFKVFSGIITLSHFVTCSIVVCMQSSDFVIPDLSAELRWLPTTLGKFLARNLAVLPSQNACGEFLH